MRASLLPASLPAPKRSEPSYGMYLGDGAARLVVLEHGEFTQFSVKTPERDTTPEEDAAIYRQLLIQAGVQSSQSPTIAFAHSAMADEDDEQDLAAAAEIAKFEVHSTLPRWLGSLNALKLVQYLLPPERAQIKPENSQILVMDAADDNAELVLVEARSEGQEFSDADLAFVSGFLIDGDNSIEDGYKEGLEMIQRDHEDLNVTFILVTGASTQIPLIMNWLETRFPKAPVLQDDNISPWLPMQGAALRCLDDATEMRFW